MPETRLIFTTDKSKLNDELSMKMISSLGAVTMAMMTCGLVKQSKPASEAASMMDRAVKKDRAKRGRDQSEPRSAMYNIASLIADRYPDMMLDPYTTMLMHGMSSKPEHDEILAASLAWVSLGRKDALTSRELVEEYLPNGYPSAKYLDELVDYYKQNPDLLWPPELVAVEIPAEGKKT